MRCGAQHAWRTVLIGWQPMSDDNAADPPPAAALPPATQALQRWQDFYASLIEDATKWAAVRALTRAVPEAIPDALLILDANGTIVMVNNQTELMFGYHRSELMGKPPEILLPPELRERHVGQRQEYVDAPRPRTMAIATDMIFPVRRKNGSEFHVHVMLNPVPTPDGICIIAVLRRANTPGDDGGIGPRHC
jgi:PAS domain S-box-containing protein